MKNRRENREAPPGVEHAGVKTAGGPGQLG